MLAYNGQGECIMHAFYPTEEPGTRFRIVRCFTYTGKPYYSIREVVGHHKGQDLTIDWPMMYGSEEQALQALAREAK